MNEVIVPDGFGATYLNPQIQTYADLVFYVKSLLGSPVTPLEITDAQWAIFIDEAISKWTQFGGGAKEEYLVFCSNMYERGCGVKLDELLSVGCNSQHCYQTVVYDSITSVDVQCDNLGTSTAYLSVSPFTYPTKYDYLNPYSTPFSGVSGQYVYLYFDAKNPWNIADVCNADCVTINPLSSQWYVLSSNPLLSGYNFDFVNSSLSNLASAVSAYIPEEYSLSSVPLTALYEGLSYIPIEYFPLSAFYKPNLYYGPPMEACVSIGNGSGYIFPNCDTSMIKPCDPLSAQYNISNTWPYIETTIELSSVNVSVSSTDFDSISSFFVNFCSDCTCNCGLLSTFNDTVSSYNFVLYKNVLSGYDGVVYDLSATDISKATHIKLYDVPSCTTDGSIPLNSNNGILGTFTLCNTALNTNGNMYLNSVQFFKDFKPPIESLYENRCGWNNNGFTMTNFISGYEECIRATPVKVRVDVSFCKQNVITNVGTVSSYLSGNIDTSINRKRKVTGIFSIDPGSSAGYAGFGGDLLFNFDYALLANTFGFDLNGTRTAMASRGYDLLTYHMAKSFVENSRKILRNITYTFDNKTQYLKVTPEPPLAYMKDGSATTCCGGGANSSFGSGLQCYLVGAYVEPSIIECLSEPWVQDWVLARAMWTVGRIRSTFTGTNIYGGVQIAGEQLVSEGQTRMDQLLKELRNDNMWVAPPSFFIN